MFILTDEQLIELRITPKTAAGNPARIDGQPIWSSSNPEVASLSTSEDGLVAKVVALRPGVSTIQVQADADLGEGFRILTGSIDVQVVPAEAVSLGIEMGAPDIRSGFEAAKPGERLPAIEDEDLEEDDDEDLDVDTPPESEAKDEPTDESAETTPPADAPAADPSAAPTE